MWKEEVMAYFNVLSKYSAGVTEETQENPHLGPAMNCSTQYHAHLILPELSEYYSQLDPSSVWVK
jgi:hypothetical protein